MTLCIAAVSRKGPKTANIVTVSDLMLSSEDVSVETRIMKVEPATPERRWVMMFAGSPTPIGSLLRGIKSGLDGKSETEDEVRTAVETAYRDEIRKKIEGEILSPFGLDRTTFLKRGRNYFGDQQFNQIVYEVRTCSLGLDLIVAGFEPSGWPRIFSISDPGVYQSHERLGFHAIGSGSMRALGSLFTHYEPSLSKAELIYRGCEAKFIGEAALGIGARTYVLTLARNPQGMVEYESLFPEDVEKHIRPHWNAHGKPPIPQGVSDDIAKNVKPTNWGT